MEAVHPPSQAALFLDWLLARRRIAFARLDRQGYVRAASQNLCEFTESRTPPLTDVHLTDLFIEFFGMDHVLQNILQGNMQEFRLAPVARETPEGTHRYLSFELLHVQSDAALPGLLVVEDITQAGEYEQRIIQERNEVRLLSAQLQRANEELRRLNEFKSTILSMAAHDLRTPIAALIIRLDILREDLLSGRQTLPHLETIEWMRYTVGRMNYMLSGLLDREQIERGALRLSLTSCDLVKVLRRVVSMAPPDARHRIELETPETLEITGDDRRLQQIFFNLLENALKYTPEEQKVTISLRRQKSEAVVEVRDRGKGMTPEEVQRLFQMFYRTEEAKRSGVPGTGLGLYIVKMLVEAHRGRIEVDSQPGRGTIFRIYLPIQPESER